MEWNNGKEWAIFQHQQAELRKKYLAAGMSEEQIKRLYEFDLEVYRGTRREALHTQHLNVSSFDDSDDGLDKSPLYKRFLEKITVTDKHWETGRFDWIEQIERKELYRAVRALSDSDKELLTELLILGLSQTEIARRRGVNKATVTKWMNRLKKYFRKFF